MRAAIILGDTRHDEDLENRYAAMLSQRDDGLVFLGHRLPDLLRTMIGEAGRQAPIVNGCEYSPDLGVPSVHIDNAAAGADVINHLVALGHGDIGIITGPLNSPLSRDRLAGVRRAALRHGIARRLTIRDGNFSVEAGFTQAQGVLAEGKSALFCFSDEMAIGALQAVDQAGLSCPEDISVVGFDDIRFARYLRPTLTTISQPTVEIGDKTVSLLLRILDGERVAMNLTLDHELIVRKSTGPRRASSAP